MHFMCFSVVKMPFIFGITKIFAKLHANTALKNKPATFKSFLSDSVWRLLH